MRIKKDLKDFLYKNLTQMAEIHLDSWKERYFGYSKSRLAFDLEINHDDSLEIEYARIQLQRKLQDYEIDYLIKQFHKEVVKQYIKN